MNPIYLALDMSDPFVAQRMVEQTRDHIGGVKIGLTLWFALCTTPDLPGNLRAIIQGHDWFLDMKWDDIGSQVAGAIQAVAPLQPTLLSIHERIGSTAMEMAVAAANTIAGLRRPKLLAVTTLTSLSATQTGVVAQAHRAMSCGLDGVIASPLELAELRSEITNRAILVTPGIRGPHDTRDDHQRSATAREAMDAGATFIVVGRPITNAASPRDAAKAIVDSLR